MAESVASIARRMGRSTKTLFRWKAAGVNIWDEVALREQADYMDIRAKGAAAQQVLNRSGMSGVTAAPTTTFARLLTQAASALGTIEALRDALDLRLEKATKLSGQEDEAGMLAEEVKWLGEAGQLLWVVLEGYRE